MMNPLGIGRAVGAQKTLRKTGGFGRKAINQVMFTIGGDPASYLAKVFGSNSAAADKPENWSEERLDMEIQSELERQGLTRWAARAAGLGSSLAAGKWFGGGR